jgi:GTP-binding protein EngB required for normal cell division
MEADVGRVLDTLDALIARAFDISTDDRLQRYADIATQTRSRLGYLGETVVIAIAGGTGVGKSSLLNAIAGTRVVPVGAIRPTTDRPKVWLPSIPEPGLTRLLDSFGIDDRIGHSGRLDVAIIDLPDFDSIEVEHRAIVQRLVPRVDAIVWTFDPQKYADRALHEDYLRPLAAHHERLLFVLNQTDLLSPEELDLVRADLVTRLDEDGIPDPTLFTTVSLPGRVSGIDPLVRFIEERLRAKRLVLGKLAEDLHGVVEGIGEIVGVDGGLDFDHRWTVTRDDACTILSEMLAGSSTLEAAEHTGRDLAMKSGPAGLLPSGRGRHRSESRDVRHAAVESAAGKIDTLITDLAFEAGGQFGSRLLTRFEPAEVERQTARALEGAKIDGSVNVSPARWWTVMSVVQWLMVVAVLAACVWGWAKPELLRHGNWPWPIIVGVGAVLMLAGSIRLVRWSGSRAGRNAAVEYRALVDDRLGEQIDRRLGVDLRTVVRDRAELVGLLTELSVQAEILGADRRDSP